MRLMIRWNDTRSCVHFIVLTPDEVLNPDGPKFWTYGGVVARLLSLNHVVRVALRIVSGCLTS